MVASRFLRFSGALKTAISEGNATKIPRTCSSRPPIVAARDSWGSRYLKNRVRYCRIESSRSNVCRVCAHRITSAIVRPLHSSVCRCLSAIQTSLPRRGMGLLVHTRDKRTVETVNQRWGMQKLSYRPEKWWPPFPRIYKVWFISTTWRLNGHRALLSQIIDFLLVPWKRNWKSGSTRWRKGPLSPWQRTSSHLPFHMRKLS